MTSPARLNAVRRFWADRSGVAAVEVAIWAAFIVVPVFSVVDIGDYIRRRMQVEAAGQAAMAKAWVFCNTAAKLPAVKNCTGLSTAMTTSAQSTSLGAGVTLSGTTEGYYCVNGSGALTQVGSTATFGGTPTGAATNCTTVGGVSGTPSLYISSTATYSYTPLVGSLSVAALLPSPITKTVWMRLS